MSHDFLQKFLLRRIFVRREKKGLRHTDGFKKLDQLKFRRHLNVDLLENREMLAVNVVVGDLLFRGDLVADAEIYRANSRPIQVGYNPTQGELFRPLVTMTGDVTIDLLNEHFGFSGTASFPGQTAPSISGKTAVV